MSWNLCSVEKSKQNQVPKQKSPSKVIKKSLKSQKKCPEICV